MKNKLLIFLILISIKSFSQQNNVQSAANSLKYNEVGDAKKFIDDAAVNEQTSNNSKMWFYRGKVYLQIHTDTAFNKLDADAVEKAAISFMNCLKTDTKGYYTDECNNLVWVAGLGLYNKGVDAYTKNDFEKATRFYNLVFDIIPLDKDNNLKRNNITAEVLNKNLYFAAAKAKDTEKAKIYLQKLIDVKYNDPMIYIYMSKIYLEQKDTTKALTCIEQGKKLFEENTTLINAELNIYIAQGKTDVLVTKLTDAINVNPDNELLYYNRGTLYENRKDYDKAAADYKKAVELKPDYFDAYYNLGAMYFNQGAEMSNAANNIKAQKDYEAAIVKADAKLKEAMPYLEKASSINPKDKNTLISLKTLYIRIADTDKYNKVKAILDNLK